MLWWTARQLKSKDPATRARAAQSLGESGDRKAVPPLLEALPDPEPTVRIAVLEALAKIPHPGAIEPLARALGSGVVSGTAEVAALAEALARQGNGAVRPLIAILESEGKEARLLAARILGRIGWHEAIGALASALDDKRSDIRREAALALGSIGDVRAFEALSRTATHRDLETRRAAIEALGSLKDDRTVPLLAAALREADEKLQLASVAALGRTGTVAAALALRPALESARKNLRDAARAALASCNPAASDAADRAALALLRGDVEAAMREGDAAIRPLSEALSSQDPGVRRAAAEALGRLDPEKSAEPLLRALGDVTAGEAAARGLLRAGATALPGLRKALASGNLVEERHAAIAAAGLSCPELAGDLAAMLERNHRVSHDYPDPLEAARAAAEALTAILQAGAGKLSAKDLAAVRQLPDLEMERPAHDGGGRVLETVVDLAALRGLAGSQA